MPTKAKTSSAKNLFKDKKRFVDNGDGTVTDNKMGLICSKKVVYRQTPKGAKNYIKKMNKKSSQKDWRLPTIHEISSILDLN